MHAANRAAWDEAAERYEGWFDEAVALIRSGGDEPVRCRDRAHRRPPRPLPAGDPPPVRRRPRHALALEPRRRRGRRRRLQPAHARARRAPDRGDRRPGALDPGRRPRHAGRARWHGRPRLHRPRLAHLAPGPRRLGRRHRPPARPDRPVRPVRGPSGRVAVRRRRRTAAGSRPTTTTSAAPRRRRAGRPSTSTDCRSPTPTRAGSSPGPGRSARSSPRCSGADLRLEAVAEHPIDWWGGHADVRAEERGRIPLSFSVGRAQGRPEPASGRSTSPSNRPSSSRSTAATARIAARSIGP